MDDIAIFHNDKNFLHNLLCTIKIYLKQELDITIKSSYSIYPTWKGIDMVGYRHFNGYKLLRRKTAIHFKQILIKSKKEWIDITEKHWCACISIAGWLTWCNSYNFYKKYFYSLIGIIGMYYRLEKKSKNKSFKHSINIWMKYEKQYKKHNCYKIQQSHFEIHKKNRNKGELNL